MPASLFDLPVQEFLLGAVASLQTTIGHWWAKYGHGVDTAVLVFCLVHRTDNRHAAELDHNAAIAHRADEQHPRWPSGCCGPARTGPTTSPNNADC